MAYYPKDRNPSGVIFFGDGGQHQVLESESTFVYKTGDGYLGIGTNNPFWELDVSGTGTFREIRWADGTSQTTAAAGAYTFDTAAGNETAVTINNTDVLRFTGLNGNINVTRSSQTIQFDLANSSFTLDGDSGPSQTVSFGDTVQIIGGSGVDTRASAGENVTVDFNPNSLADTAIADGDTIVFIDAGDNGPKKEAFADMVSFMAGDGLTAANSVLAVNTDGTTIETNGDAIRIAATAAGDGLAGGGGSALSVNTDGTTIETNGDAVRIAATAAGDGLGGGGGSALSVNVDDTTIEINADTLRVKDSGITEAKISRTVQYNPVPVGELTFDVNMVSGANEAYTLPTVTLNTGKIVRVKKTDQAASSVRISGNAVGQLIDSGNIYFLYNYNEAVTLICDGSNWQVF
jgi:hypothetical protein